VSITTLEASDTASSLLAGISKTKTSNRTKLLFVMPIHPIALSKWPIPLAPGIVLKIGVAVRSALKDCWQNGLCFVLLNFFVRLN
jgi:hypothetical protein